MFTAEAMNNCMMMYSGMMMVMCREFVCVNN